MAKQAHSSKQALSMAAQLSGTAANIAAVPANIAAVPANIAAPAAGSMAAQVAAGAALAQGMPVRHMVAIGGPQQPPRSLVGKLGHTLAITPKGVGGLPGRIAAYQGQVGATYYASILAACQQPTTIAQWAAALHATGDWKTTGQLTKAASATGTSHGQGPWQFLIAACHNGYITLVA